MSVFEKDAIDQKLNFNLKEVYLTLRQFKFHIHIRSVKIKYIYDHNLMMC